MGKEQANFAGELEQFQPHVAARKSWEGEAPAEPSLQLRLSRVAQQELRPPTAAGSRLLAGCIPFMPALWPVDL
jgi:hypothetical protein